MTDGSPQHPKAETTLANLYEGMFLLDNQAVREDWGHAKAHVTDTLVKHGAEVVTARRWDERRLAYPIKGRQRGTYLLTYYKASGDAIPTLRRDLELDDRVLRYLLLRAEELPEGEADKSQAELADDFTIPPPPEDDEPEEEPEPEREPRRHDRDRDRGRSRSEAAPKKDAAEEAKDGGAKVKADAPEAEAPKAEAAAAADAAPAAKTEDAGTPAKSDSEGESKEGN